MMFKSFRSVVLSATVVAMTAAAPALANVTMECKIDQHAENGSWIGDVIYVTNKGDGAVVLDAIIQHFTGGPMDAKIDTDNASRTTYSWKVKTKTSTNQYADMAYRLTIMKADKTASVTARPTRYAQNFTARGKCKQVKG